MATDDPVICASYAEEKDLLLMLMDRKGSETLQKGTTLTRAIIQ